uniref:MSP domain-containing protein n=1 Tax=Panagrellus redivivus TaxID=6233 RepID=A0A7E4UNQ7_PANRE
MSKISKSEMKKVSAVTGTLPLLPLRLVKINRPVPRASWEAAFPLNFDATYVSEQLIFLSDDPILEKPNITVTCLNPHDQTFMVMVCTSSSILFNVTPPFCYAHKALKTRFRVQFIGAFVPALCQKVAFYAQPINITHLPARVVSNCGVRQQQTGVHRFRIRFYTQNGAAVIGKLDLKHDLDRNLLMEFPRLSAMPQGIDKLMDKDKEKEPVRVEPKPLRGPTPGRNYDWRKTTTPPPENVKPRPKDPEEAVKYDYEVIKHLPMEQRIALYKKRFEEDKVFRLLLAKELGKREWGCYDPSDEVVGLLKEVAAGKKVKISRLIKRELTKHCHPSVVNYEDSTRKAKNRSPLLSGRSAKSDPKRKSKESTSDSRSRNTRRYKKSTTTKSNTTTRKTVVMTRTTVNNVEERAPTMLRHKRGQLGIVKTERAVDHQRKKFVKTAQTLSMEATQQATATETEKKDTPGHPAEVWSTLREQLGRIMQCNPWHPSLMYNKQKHLERGERAKRRSLRQKLSNASTAAPRHSKERDRLEPS